MLLPHPSKLKHADVKCWEIEAETQTTAFQSSHLSDGAKVKNKSIWTLNTAWDIQARDT